MLGAKWRNGAMAGLLAVALTGCSFLTGGKTPTKTPDPDPAHVVKLRGDKRGEAYDADIAANEARKTAIIFCGNLPYKDLISTKCKSEPRKELYEKSQACDRAIKAYNDIRGPEERIDRFVTINPRRGNQKFTCAFDEN